VDVVPIFWIFQPGGTAYGVAVDPFAFKWNFNAHGRYVPYADIDGGVLFTNRQTRGERRELISRERRCGNARPGEEIQLEREVRYAHISNAGIASINPGINTLQVRIGIGMLRGLAELNAR